MKTQAEIVLNIAFCKGFVQGYEDGFYQNPFKRKIEQLDFRDGFNAGVAEYINSIPSNQDDEHSA